MKIKSLLFIIVSLLIMADVNLTAALGKTIPVKDKAETSPTAFSSDQKESLRGLKGLFVLVEPLPPDIEKVGISAEQLKEDVEARLKQAGIKVLNEDEEGAGSKESGKPHLFINFTFFTLQKDLTYGYSLNVYLNQLVLLQRDTKIGCLGTTWYSGGIGIIRVNKLKNVNQTELAEHIDKFINNFLAVNPK